VRALAAQGLLVVEQREVAAETSAAPLETPLEPTPGQAQALAAITEALDARAFQAFLLHG
jgi:hypothetical protein